MNYGSCNTSANEDILNELNQPKPSYIDFIKREEEYTKSSRYAKDVAFWENEVKNIEPCTILKNNEDFDKTARRFEYEVPEDLNNKIGEFCEQNKITEYTFYLSIIAIYFYGIYGMNNFAIGTPFLNRQKRFKEFEETGLHITTLPLPVNVDANMDFIEFCRRINSENLRLFKHGNFPYYNIQKMFNEEKNTNSNLYEVAFSYQINVSTEEFKSKTYNKDDRELANQGVGECSWLFSGAQNNSITFHITQLNVKKLFCIDYLTSAFSDEQVKKINKIIYFLIEQALEKQPKVEEFQLATAEDIELLKKFNATGDFFAKLTEENKAAPTNVAPTNVLDYLNEIVEKHPNKTALIFNNANMTYAEFTTKVNAVASKLVKDGIKPNSPVVLMFDKSFDMIVAMFAVLKAGCYYVPILPDENDARIKYIINDCKPICALTHKNYINILSNFVEKCYNLECDFSEEESKTEACNNKNKTEKAVATQSFAAKPFTVQPTDVAYTIYTSGSTGRPKGVQVTHQNIICFIESMKQNNELKPKFSDVSMSLLKYSFDASGIDIYSSLLLGGTLLLVGKEDELNAVKVLELIEKYGVTRSFLIPKWIEHIATTALSYNYNISSLKILGTGGEMLKPSILKEFLNKYNTIKIANLYGPTETTMFTTYKIITNNEIDSNSTTIGRPIPGSRIAVVNSNNVVLPTGTQGELVVYEDDTSIKNIATGYLNLPEQTKKRFIEFYNPISNSVVKAYKTGDIARIKNNSFEIEFIGRNDDIVKVNGGYLVALNEVEKRISDLLGEAIESYCVAVPYKNTKAIVLFVKNTEKTISSVQIKKYLKDNLSFYMQPRKIVEIDEIPRISSGKVNRQKLKELATKELQKQSNNLIQPRTDIEMEIYSIVKEISNQDEFSVTDDFINDLGIDSLALTSIYVALSSGDHKPTIKDQNTENSNVLKANAPYKKPRGYKITMQDIYTNPTVQDLAKFIESKNSNATLVPELENIENIEKIISQSNSTAFDLSTVLLTGVTGFLGIHLLHELLLNKKVKKIYCIIRNKIGIEAQDRLKGMIDFYYNSSPKLFKLIEEKVIILNGEITKTNFNLSDDTYMMLQKSIKTVINSAANVRHYAKPEEFKEDNITSVDNIIEFCGKNISLAHISTMSIAGFKGKNTQDISFTEKKLYIGQEFNNNLYLVSKFNAECHILKAVSNKALNAKIFRLGNIMPRQSDLVFQKNRNQNIFLSSIKTILDLKVIPAEMLDLKLELSPVDECAKAIIGLMPDETMCVYHILNNNEVSIKNIIKIFEKLVGTFTIVSMNKFRNLLEGLEDKYIKEYILGTNLNVVLQRRTLKLFGRFNFSWSKSDEEYILGTVNFNERN